MNFREHARTIATLAILTTTSTSLLWPGAAVAQPNMAQMLQQRFEAADTNHDGRLSKTEADSGMPRVAQHFDEIDASHAGSITLQQIVDFARKQQGG